MPKSFMTPQGAVPERVSLSKTQQRILTDMADAIIAETLQTNEMFVSNGRQLPNDQWKHVKSKEKVHVYRSRHSKGSFKPRGQSQDEKDPSRPRLLSLSAMERHERENSGRPSSSADGSFSLADDCVLSKVKPSHVPLVIATGVIDGTVEDVAFGAFANTRKSWITRNSEEDPFRSVTIKWSTGNYGAFTTRRDFLYVESMGMAFDSDGEKIFYNLIHSIELDDCPPLDKRHNIIRVQMSTCYIARQVKDNSVEMFCRGFVDPRGEMMESYGILMLAHNVSACSGYVECSNLKKLSWMVRRSDTASPLTGTDCSVCHKSLKKLGLLQSPSGCTICRCLTCNKCSVQKKLTIDVTKEILQKSFTFCLSCVIEAKELSAWELAAAAVRRS
ncbi:NAD-dependent histone deacetylase sir2 protein [Phytophthora nicotianae]|uniref:NAD-dependent histone deacetylase sir2 protein n=1 Tax=Phytophthora nicotianae TaxID=4792 RepID=A0A0W8DA41_PHYNI|nr:NAD-dependent histone deacetylase sir2 protein [Phytophthora nicotianae]